MARQSKVVKLGGTNARAPIIPARDVEEAVHNLLRQGWTRMENASLGRRFETTIATFIGLCNDPDRKEFLVRHEREKDDGEYYIGLMEETAGEMKNNPRADEVAEGRLRKDENKFKYHHNSRALGYLGFSPLFNRHSAFLLEISRLHCEAVILGLDIAEELDRQMPGYSFLERMREAEHLNLMRLLRYMCDGKSPHIAKRHRDKDFLTVHVRSDRDGLFLVDPKDNIIADAEETRANSTLIFFGRKAWEISRGRLKGIVHGVRDTTFGDLTDRMPRHTAVSFLHASVKEPELEWAKEHMDQLSISEYVENWIRQSVLNPRE